MTDGRLASSVLVSALMRKAQGEGGFAAVIAKGDATAGAIGVILAEKGAKACFLERMLGPNGTYAWQRSDQPAQNDADFAKFLEKRRRFDPDLWILELDVPSAERFAAEMND